jgi:[acyl-carrier-protein] S-malonyltransferase
MNAATSRLAVLFPGQGVGSADSRALVRDYKPELLHLASDAVGEDPFARMRESTRFAQPAVFCATLAAYERLGRPQPDFFAGHSLGEVAALVAADAVDEQDGLAIVIERGRVMELVAQQAPAGGMLAVGAPIAAARSFARRHGLTVANENSPEQAVLSGAEAALQAALDDAKSNGLRATRLRVAGPFHTAAMAPGVAPYRDVLAQFSFRPPSVPVYSSMAAAPFDPDPRDALAQALVRPVRWVDLLLRLRSEGAQRFIDVGPGRVLAGLLRRTIEDASVDAPPVAEAIGA